ncbi:hypothetical protein GP486_003846 [Trichoglossum hirsutum]|uniref:PAN2-PAN3 deadenylation complex catalytic subunit PAN2 n=1 Tax=Trichoglossum hirsutum TaxID=265104 RepID=A0A9P8RQ29_9PEZI|nr:hypothetical protein GP486_003846 [Trichoglossum hirsutum]
MKDLRCMSYTSKGNSEVLVAGMQSTMFTVDVDRGQVTREITTEDSYTVMKRSRYICAATTSGSINMLDPNTFNVIKTWKAHAAAISDMDAQNNFLVTCGYSPRHQQSFMLDPLANVYDLRMLRPLPPIPFHAGAAFVRMHPKMSTTSIVASQNGQLQVVDLMNPNTVNLRQANVSSYLTTLELASSGDALALADADCSIHLWGSPEKLRFSEFSNPTELPDVPASLPPIEWTAETPLSSIGLPYYREQLLSAWPSHLIFEVGSPPAKIDPDILSSMTSTDFGGWAPNPRKTRRNQVENTRIIEKASVPLMAPKFLSEKARESVVNSKDERRASDVGDALGDASIGGLKADVPAMYRNVEIKYSKFGVDDFDFEFYNKTKYSGLETHIANSYSNPLLQLFKFTPLLRNLALQHTATNCLTETCLLCEMGFLFDMLDKAGGQNCQATNFLKTFSSIPQAGALGLLEEDSPNSSLTLMIQAVNRFLLERISIDYKHVFPQSPLLDQNAGKSHMRNPQPSFSQILKASVERENQTRGWCDKCRRYQSLATRKSIQDIPNVLMINAAVNSPEAKELWAAPGWLPEEIGVIVEDGQFFCYEGEDLRLHLQRGIHYITVYELVGLVEDINSGENQASHLVSLVNVAISARERQPDSQWHLFNDFLVRKVTKEEALEFSPSWKAPSVLAYQIKSASNAVDDSWKEHLDTSLLYLECSLNQRITSRGYHVLSPQTEAPRAGTQVAIDAEFVALQQEEIEIKADGSRETIRPSRLGLARVSVLRGAGINEGLPFIDDYIVTNEPVVDYLTAFSGIRAGDLDPKRSEHDLVPLKVAYKKLWLLLNLGCVFVGHGLPKDFRTINIHVPKNQVIDTVDLFFIKSRQRKLSLRFLSWLLLKEDIQLETHDSIEDARTALKLYRKYQEFQDAGILEPMLNDIYARGREVNYKAPSAQKTESGTLDRRDTPPILYEGVSAPKTPVKREAALNTVQQGQSWTSGPGGYFSSPLR